MFEGNPPKIADATPLDAASPARGLRMLSWGELVSRLAATKGRHGAETPPQGDRDASFDSGSARRLAAHDDGKDFINLDNSGNSKMIGRTVAAGSNDDSADRGNI